MALVHLTDALTAWAAGLKCPIASTAALELERISQPRTGLPDTVGDLSPASDVCLRQDRHQAVLLALQVNHCSPHDPRACGLMS
jgi:hypothetical protein